MPNPVALAIGLTTDAGPGGVDKLSRRCDELSEKLGIPVLNASIATQQGLRAIGAQRIAVMTPFNAEVDQVVKANIEAGGFEAVEGMLEDGLDGNEAVRGVGLGLVEGQALAALALDGLVAVDLGAGEGGGGAAADDEKGSRRSGPIRRWRRAFSPPAGARAR